MPLTFAANQARPASRAKQPAPVVRDVSPALRLHRLTAQAMVARLAALLDRLDAVPTEEWAPWADGGDLYRALRHGKLATRPARWPWPHSLAGWEAETWQVAITGGVRDIATWHAAWPVAALRDLDERAYLLRVDTRREWLTGKGAQW